MSMLHLSLTGDEDVHGKIISLPVIPRKGERVLIGANLKPYRVRDVTYVENDYRAILDLEAVGT